MSMKTFDRELERYAIEGCGMTLFGIADLDGLRQYVEPGIEKATRDLKCAVVIALRVSQAVLDTLVDSPNLLYKHHYQQVNYRLDRAALEIAEWIMEKGYEALPIPASKTMDRTQTRAHFSHRHAAVASGMGYSGRHTLVVTPQFGSQIRLATILTDIPLTSGSPLDMDCGSCRACIEACPAKALSDDGFDFERCYAELKKFKGRWGMGQYICGVCLRVCNGRES